uniref:Bm7695 n=1 Tax=Brugia malayi TaxID=6279 RepID=A0A1I9FZJ0_BRUMA|nr:Bm7695 [Brugia malayi]
MPKVVSHPNRQTNTTDGRTDDDGPTDERMGDEWIDKRRNGWMDGHTSMYVCMCVCVCVCVYVAVDGEEFPENREYEVDSLEVSKKE